ncbi:MAG: class I SAM-dependent methyltransferase [Thermoplasmata archaeon]
MAEERRARGPPRSPADRVRARLRAVAGERLAEEMPAGYQRMGRVLLVRLPERYRAHFATIGRAWQAELGVETVLNRSGAVRGELREPDVERLAGTETETEVVEHGVRWRFDAARILFAAGNKAERRRVGELVGPAETVVDLFAGIGYFAIPAARGGGRVVAVEKNPVAFGYLVANVARNGVADRVECVRGDNRTVPLSQRAADRVLLGFLPDALPWLPRALELVRPDGGWLHVHTVEGSRTACDAARRAVAAAAERVGATLLAPLAAREVKPYGPGRTHVVVDARLRPAG